MREGKQDQMETFTSKRQEAGGRGQVIKKAIYGGQTAWMKGQALPPTSSVTLRACTTWAGVHILTCKVHMMTYHHHGAAVKIK